jgi:uncharacterized membrane protein YdbT with pleckstrin-like domain
MSYVDTVLDEDEQVLYRAKLHWMIYSTPIILIAVGVLFLGAKAGMWIVLAGLAWLFVKYLQRNATEIAVTNKRVIVKYGILSRLAMELNTRKIESVIVNQDWAGRMNDYGTVIIRGTGAGIEPIANVAEPLMLRQAIGKAIPSA